MRQPVVDELEERRVARRLTALAEAVEPLPDRQLDAILSAVALGVPVRRPARGLRARASRHVSGVAAAAAAAALAIAVGIGNSQHSPDDRQVRGSVPERLLSFPEGSALELLLSQAGEERPA